MRRVLDDLLRHGEKPRIVDEERLVQERKKICGCETERGTSAGQNSNCRNRVRRVSIHPDLCRNKNSILAISSKPGLALLKGRRNGCVIELHSYSLLLLL